MILKPSQRNKIRYITFHAITKGSITGADSFDAIRSSAHDLIGDLGMSKAGMAMMPRLWNGSSQRGTLRVSRAFVEQTRAAICMTTTIGRRSAVLRTVGISGMINKSQGYLKEE